LQSAGKARGEVAPTGQVKEPLQAAMVHHVDVRPKHLARRQASARLDAGYVTVTPECRFEVSRRIREEFANGREYYALHGKPIELPRQPDRHPDRTTLNWHNDNRFRS